MEAKARTALHQLLNELYETEGKQEVAAYLKELLVAYDALVKNA
jgi:hypothetical protein